MEEERDEDEIRVFWEKVSDVFSGFGEDSVRLTRKDEEKLYRMFVDLKSKCFSKKDDVDVFKALMKLKDRVAIYDCSDDRDKIVVEKSLLERYIRIVVSICRDRVIARRKRRRRKNVDSQDERWEALRRERRQLRSNKTLAIVQHRIYGVKSLPLVELVPEKSFQEEEEVFRPDFCAFVEQKIRKRNEEIETARQQRYSLVVMSNKEEEKKKEVVMKRITFSSQEDEEKKMSKNEQKSEVMSFSRPELPLHPKFRQRMIKWMKEIGFDEERLCEIFLHESGARNLRDVCNFVRDMKIVREIFGNEMNEKEMRHFLNHALQLRDDTEDLDGTGAEIMNGKVARKNDLVFLPNAQFHLYKNKGKKLKWWSAYWVAQILNTRWKNQSNLCLLRLFVQAGCDDDEMCNTFVPSKHIFEQSSRNLYGPLHVRYLPRIRAYEILDEISIDRSGKTWIPRVKSTTMPTFEECVRTRCVKVNSVLVIRVFVRPHDRDVIAHTQKLNRDMKMAFRRTLNASLWTVNTESIRVVNTSILSEFSRVYMYCEKDEEKIEETIVEVRFAVIVPGKSFSYDEDNDNEEGQSRKDWTLETLMVAFEEKLRSKICGENFSSFCEVTLLAFTPVHVRSAIPVKPSSLKQRFLEKKEEHDDDDDDIVVELYRKGSYVYFANPDYDPHLHNDDDDQNDPFYVGRVLRANELGIYTLQVLRRDVKSIDKSVYVEPTTNKVVAYVRENALKPVYDLFRDFRNNLHCVTELNPFVMTLDTAAVAMGSNNLHLDEYDEKRASTRRLGVGPSVCKRYL